MVFDDEDSDLTELLKPHSVVRREAPASIDSSALHPHSAMKKAHPGSKLAAHGLWKKHPKSSAKHKAKKLGSVAALMAPPTVKKGKSHSTKPLKSARNLLKQLWASNDEYDYDDEDDYVKNDDILSEASGSGSSPLDVDSDDDNDDDGDVIESSGHSCDGGDCEPDELDEKKTDASEGGDSSAQPEGPLSKSFISFS